MKTIELEYSIVTPMFIGDADQNATSFRVPSLKGALRFWWRALVWAQVQDQPPHLALAALHDRERKLFGDASGKNGSSQSCVLLSVRTPTVNPVSAKEILSPPNQKERPGVKYLMGQGLEKRKALAEGRTIEIEALFRPGVGERDRLDVERAFFALGLFGGLGSRARRGLGSLALRSVTGKGRLLRIEPPATRADFKKAVEQLLGPLPKQEPPFSAFSSQTRIDLSLCGKDALTTLDAVGKCFAAFRESQKTDARLAGTLAAGGAITKPPSRIVFGLPLPFYFKESKKTVGFDVGGPDRDRRASPLFLHLHHFPGERSSPYSAVHTVLPAAFLPNRDRIRTSVRSRRSAGSSGSIDWRPVNWRLIDDYLDSYSEGERPQPGFERVLLP